MILQTIFILIYKSITVIMLLLNQIEQEQTEYIICIDNKFCYLNMKTINKKILVNIQHEKYIHILINSELAIDDKFYETITYLMFKKQLDLIVVNETHLMSIEIEIFKENMHD